MTADDHRWGSRPYSADQALEARIRSATRAPFPEGGVDDGGGGPMGQSQCGNR